MNTCATEYVWGTWPPMALRLGAAAADLAALVLLCVAVERWPGAVLEARRGAVRLSLTVRSRMAGPAIALLGAVLATGAVWSLHARWSRVPGTLEEPPIAEALTAASPDDAASSASGDSAEALGES